ncbi:substrate-binding domain-containing protein [Bifidobacterium sp. SMB2]|uniref:Substrate-binding domain-containing protein n=1 Tax=Bifidobacterium saimiriisciurei TaxID=2661627 RepID=A0ABX0CCZ4_9BIFI|nr:MULTISPECIES: LacI family DNA-binding transcriptional regulator [Bifidobacterium]NEG95835.1 substrate-binding domain-containing protein [Bifidobacterium sp. SMB2]NEH12096.1 substrate-binding domain-containing protein [Bifidobacterium saimiriisciurei]
MARRTTIKDVAAAAGVSVTAVSLVLNNRPSRVSEETRRAILEAAKTLDYVPNQVARTLVTQRSMLLAFVVPDIQNLFFASLAKRLEDECRRMGYSLIIANTDDSRDTEHDVITRLAARGVDGMFLISAGESGADMEGFRLDVTRCGCPVVLVDRMPSGAWCDAVGIDNHEGGRLAARCLMEHGHRRIACVSGDVRIGNAGDRRDGFVEALGEAGLRPAAMIEGDYRHAGGYAAADVVVESGATAVFCCNDLMALGLMRRLSERGLRVPDDMSVMGYDGIAERFGFEFDLTTVGQGIGRLAGESAAMMKGRIERSDAPAGRRVVIPPKLISRGSVAAVR